MKSSPKKKFHSSTSSISIAWPHSIICISFFGFYVVLSYNMQISFGGNRKKKWFPWAIFNNIITTKLPPLSYINIIHGAVKSVPFQKVPLFLYFFWLILLTYFSSAGIFSISHYPWNVKTCAFCFENRLSE